jgi:hypothetical protein
MKEYIRHNRVLLILLALVMVVSLFVMAGRFGVEKNNKTYDIVLDYNEILAMAQQSTHSVDWWLAEFKEMGIRQVGLTEESIVTLMEETEYPVTGVMMNQLLKESHWSEKYPQGFVDSMELRGYDVFDVVVSCQGPIREFVKQGITERIQPDRYILWEEDDALFVFLDGTADVTLYSEKYKYQNSDNTGYQERIDIVSSKIMFISLGFLPEKVAEIQKAEMDIVPRTMSYNGWNDTKFAQAVLEGYQEYDIQPDYIIVGGQAVFGYDEGLDFARDYILNNNVTIGLIENTTQRQNIMQFGVEEVAQSSQYDAVRVFTVWPYIQNRYQYYGYEGAKEIENTLFRAVVERNIRVIYYKPIFEMEDLHTYVTDVEEYRQLFYNLEERLAEHGFTPGKAVQMSPYQVGAIQKIMMGLGSVLGVLLLLGILFPIPKKVQLALGIVGGIGVAGMALAMPEWFELTASFFGSVVISSIAVSFFTYQARLAQDHLSEQEPLGKIIVFGVGTLVVAVAIALLGGLFGAAPISSIPYMLEIDIFRGVKVAQLLPMAFYVLAFLAFFGYGESKKKVGRLEFHDIKELLNLSVKIWMIVLGILVLGLGAYYIIRTGHSSNIEVSSLEMVVRNKMEDLLIARPRTKEFLIAFPAIIMMIYASVRRFKLWTILFGLAGVIGMTSVSNTFQHIRTPLYLGVYRTGYGLLFGIILGVLGVLLWEGCYRGYHKLYRKYMENHD